MTKANVLFILHLPKPIHGAAIVGKYIKESVVINHFFNADYINLSTSDELHNIGKLGITKLLRFINLQLNVIHALLTKRYSLSYVTLNSKGRGLYKDFLIVLILKLFRCNIIYHFHNKGVSSRQEKLIDNILYKIAFKNTLSIILSPSLYGDIAKYVKREDVFFCSNGCMTSIMESCQSNIHVRHPQKCQLLFLSNMMVEKGIFVLLEACFLLKQKEISFECHFVGDWTNVAEQDFIEVVTHYALQDCVFVYGKRYGKEKQQFLMEADIFVFPTFYDCFPLVLLEAMEWSLPIVTTYEGGIPDIVIDGETGFLVQQESADALAEKVGLLINDPQLRHSMGSKGKERYDALYTIEKFEKNLTGILETAIAKTKKQEIN